VKSKKERVLFAHVDSFTSTVFHGNPAAVCVFGAIGGLAEDADWMQNIASEMNLSETAFVLPSPSSAGVFLLRWFTPLVEVDLCGHATLAAGHVLWESGAVPLLSPIFFETKSGLLTLRREKVGSARRVNSGQNSAGGRKAGTDQAEGSRKKLHASSGAITETGWISMDFPADLPTAVDSPSGLAEALGATPVWTGRGRYDLFVVLPDARSVRELAPSFAALRRLDTRGIIVTGPGDEPGIDFLSRFFAPCVGIDEDPVTGSAHVCLASYWSARLGKERLVGKQVSRRTGIVRTALLPKERVLLCGQAVTLVRGELAL